MSQEMLSHAAPLKPHSPFSPQSSLNSLSPSASFTIPTSNTNLYTPLALPSLGDDDPNRNLFRYEEPSPMKKKISRYITILLRIKDTLKLTLIPFINILIMVVFTILGGHNYQTSRISSLNYASESWMEYPIVDIMNMNNDGSSCPNGYKSLNINVGGVTISKWKNNRICMQFGNSSSLAIPTLPSARRRELRYCNEQRCINSCVTNGAKCPVVHTNMLNKESGTINWSNNSSPLINGSTLLHITITTIPASSEKEKRPVDLDSLPATDFLTRNGQKGNSGSPVTYYLRAYYEIPWMISSTCDQERSDIAPFFGKTNALMTVSLIVIALTIFSSLIACCFPWILIINGKCEMIWCPQKFKAQVKANHKRMARLVAKDQTRMNEFVDYLNEVEKNLLEHFEKYVISNPTSKVNIKKLKLKALPQFPRTIMKDPNESFCGCLNRLRNSNIMCLTMCGNVYNNCFSCTVFILMIVASGVIASMMGFFALLSEERCSDPTMNDDINNVAGILGRQLGWENMTSIILKGILVVLGVIGIVAGIYSTAKSILAWCYRRKQQVSYSEYMADLIHLNSVITILRNDYGFVTLRNVC